MKKGKAVYKTVSVESEEINNITDRIVKLSELTSELNNQEKKVRDFCVLVVSEEYFCKDTSTIINEAIRVLNEQAAHVLKWKRKYGRCVQFSEAPQKEKV